MATDTSPQVYFLLSNRTTAIRATVLALLLAVGAKLFAADVLTLWVGDLSREGWYARDVTVQLHLASPTDQYILTVSELYHPALDQVVKQLRLVCTQGFLSEAVVSCQKGVAEFIYRGVKQKKVNLKYNFNISTQDYELTANNVRYLSAHVDFRLILNDNNWRLNANGKRIELDHLKQLVPVLAEPLKAFSASARFDLSSRASGTLNELKNAQWQLTFSQLSFADQSSAYLGEGLVGSWSGEVKRSRGQWLGEHKLQLTQGEILTPYFYLSAIKQSVSLKLGLTYQPKSKALNLSPIDFRHGQLMVFTGDMGLSLGDAPKMSSINIRSSPSELSALFKAYLQPVLVNPLFEDIELAGKVAFELNKDETSSNLSLGLDAIHLEQGLKASETGRGQFALYGLNGQLNWSDKATKDSQLSWQGGHLYGGVTLGPSSLSLNMSGNRIALAQPTGLPILDGKLQAEQFELTQGEKGPKVRFQGYLTPISMEAISNAMGWPLLSGQLSGMIPGIAYEDGVIAVEGLALVRVFDGDILIKQLKLDDLFGSLPALSANLEMKNIDLETLTRAFSFGKITGKLAGRVDDLRLENWQPVSFDARFETPENDESRHRINQKAVDNISNLGGAGVSGAISRSFLRFFEEFGYDRLGISCRLERGVCQMGGIESAEKGYYLVKGGGIPRIDIMGFNRRTDWHVLVSKLKQISQGGAPIIE
ncbi:MAG: hypothetical protein OQL20_08350 [Sedimenticola sp.]|nr:hypothetical protein [Sedimenticola sp.]